MLESPLTSAAVRIEPVVGAKALRTFVDLPARLYDGLAGFEPPLAIDRRMMLDPKSSSLWKKAKVCYWLAWSGDRPVGRISAQIEDTRPIGISATAGGFGCLDAIDDRGAGRNRGALAG